MLVLTTINLLQAPFLAVTCQHLATTVASTYLQIHFIPKRPNYPTAYRESGTQLGQASQTYYRQEQI